MNLQKIESGYKESAERSYSYGNNNNRKYPFNLLSMRNLQPGRYRMRFLWPEPSKNPDGMYFLATHTLIQNDKSKERFLSAENLGPGEGYPGVTQVLDYIEEKGVFEKLKNMGDKTKGIRDAITALVPWNRYWVPVFIYAVEVPASDPDGYPTFRPEFQDGVAPLDKILEINQSVKLVGAIFDAFRAYPDLDSRDSGRDVYLTVSKNRYKLEVSPKTSRLAPSLVKFASDNYPDLPALARRFYAKDPAEIVGMVKATWWAKSLEKGGIVFPDYVPSYVDDLAEELNLQDDEDASYVESAIEEEEEGADLTYEGGGLGDDDYVEADTWTEEELGESESAEDGPPFATEPSSKEFDAKGTRSYTHVAEPAHAAPPPRRTPPPRP